MIAKKTVDLAPALVLAAQLIMGILFGILGLFLADPLLAMMKVALERRAESTDAAGTRRRGIADRWRVSSYTSSPGWPCWSSRRGSPSTSSPTN